MPVSTSSPSPSPGFAQIQLQPSSGACTWLELQDPIRIIHVTRLSDVRPALLEAEAEAHGGRYVVCCVSYEASPAFDAACTVHPPGVFPLVWIGVYTRAREIAAPQPRTVSTSCHWRPQTNREDYASAIGHIHEWIAAGHSYQVNFTTRLTTPFDGDASALFADLLTYQPHGYAAYLDIGDHTVCSLSPELFFALEGNQITCRPMKGTATRGVTNHQDRERAAALQASPKNRAENVMIVDMIRNDLGRIATPGSVRVDHLYDIERYRTVFQMTSTVSAHTEASLPDIFQALFPCASITGAPKVRTMEIIRELETSPRGIYTGCIGLLRPGRSAQFNVAIRTVQIDRPQARASYGTGGGIVWDSTAADEYRECLTKALVLRPPPPHLQLLETLRWTPQHGYTFVDLHLDRVLDSAHYFEIQLDRDALEASLDAQARSLTPVPHRIRLLVTEDGAIRTESTPLDEVPFCDDPDRCVMAWKVALAREPIDPANRFLYHKTTHRRVYDRAMADVPMARDVLLWNTRNELTESCVANLVVELDGRWLTPPVSCGLLGGTYRRHLLAAGRIHEAVLPVARLSGATRLFLINSVRGWVRAEVEEVERMRQGTG